MSNFFENNASALSEFARVSGSVGARADYVQGGGGNTSVKLADGLMAIKASGYCLKDITPAKAYAVLNYAELRSFYNNSNPADFADVEKAGSEEAKKNTQQIDGLAALRPSVEAGFHSILDTYVAHSHSVYANLCACCEELKDITAKALADADYTWGWVEYTDPGARLTFSIRDEL
ncbi:MAG: class II aldolase/adducin family protein, partial [Firmicutes bacterium]|nr:class II aldolase/adducin family protein [Bacillota bacterium]